MPHYTRRSAALLGGGAAALMSGSAQAQSNRPGQRAEDLPIAVHTFASPDPDSVNTHAIQTADGLFLVGAQRVHSQAERAIVRLRRLGQPVVGILISVPHTDHFGGLPMFRAAFPQARVYASAATIESMRTDSQGYIAGRKKALGDDFPSLDDVQRTLPDAVVRDGERLDIGGVRMDVLDLPGNNAPANTLLHLPEHAALFSSEVVENGVTAFLRDADLNAWLSQLDALRTRLLPGLRVIYPAHGSPAAPAEAAFTLQGDYLTAFRDLVHGELGAGGELGAEARGRVADEMERRYPDFAQVARLDRRELLAQSVGWQAPRLAAAR